MGKIKHMKVIVLAAGSRAGLELFQSLLDGHSQVLQLPGIIYVNEDLIRILSIKSKKNLAKEFIKNYPNFFDSRKTDVERHYMLGSNKKKYYIIDKKSLLIILLGYQKKKKKFKNDLFQKLYVIHKAYNFRIIKKDQKIFVINAHILPYVMNFDKYFPGIKYDILHTIRHPLSSISSVTNNWIKFKDGIFFTPKELYYNLELIFFGIGNLLKLKRKIYIIQLENLHQNFSIVMRNFCKVYNIKFSKSLKVSSFHNLKWWGDKISGKDLNGVNKNFRIKYDMSKFFERDIDFFQKLFGKNFLKYNYKKLNVGKFYYHIFPLRCELITWKNTLKNYKIKHILSIPYFYFKRLIFFNLSFKQKIKLPNSIGLKKTLY